MRYVVASHPFPADGGSRDNRYEVFRLSADGALTATGFEMQMGTLMAPDKPIVFTPDGKVGVVAQEDGSLGVFTLGPQGEPTVVHARLEGDFYADSVVMAPDGRQLYVLDVNFPVNGGGLFRLDIGCDGALSNEVKLTTTKLLHGGAWLPDGHTLALAASEVGASLPEQDLHLLDVGVEPPALLSSVVAFPDRDAIPSGVSVSPDGAWLALADNSMFAGSRVAFIRRQGQSLAPAIVVTVDNPLGVTFSPFTASGLLVSSDGSDAFRRFDLGDGGVTVASETLAYVHGRPQLPGAPVMVRRGALEGRLLIAEVDAIRQLQFLSDGGIADVSKTPASGVGSAQIVGGLGVTP